MQPVLSQTGPGIGLYATGTEAGMGFRSARDKKFAADIRLTRANFYKDTKLTSFITECSLIYRVVYLEKVRFHMGLGYRADWNLNGKSQQGAVIPIGLEAFPFSFQNAGLFFECGLYAGADTKQNWHGGLRTAAGIVFYFPKKQKNP